MDRLKRAVYSPGDFLPPERSLAEEFKVSRPTLRKALAPLLKARLLVNHPGLGTSVAFSKTAPRERKATATGNNRKVLGLVLPDFDNRFYTEITEAIEYTALQRGYQVLLCNSRHQPGIEETHIRQLAEHKVDGVVLAHDPSMPFPPSVSLLHDAEIQYVALFTAPAIVSCDSVMVDEYAGISQMLRYLVSLGHRHIAYCRPTTGDRPHPREKAYLQFMEQSGWAVPSHFLLPYEAVHHPGGREMLRDLLAQDPAPTALLAGNDRTALLVLKHMAKLGVPVPQEISVAGFDNLRFTEHLAVPLTTIDQPKREMGRRAVELLLERIELGISPVPRVEVFQPHLVIRESCGVAPALRLSPVA